MDFVGVEKVRLEPWGEGDFWLLRRANSPEMTAHLGGPESEEKLAGRHRRYLELGLGQMYRVVLAGTGESVGSVGFWARERRGAPAYGTFRNRGRGLGLDAAVARALAGPDEVDPEVPGARVVPARETRGPAASRSVRSEGTAGRSAER